MAENGDVFSPKAEGKTRRQILSLDMVRITNPRSALPTLGGTGSGREPVCGRREIGTVSKSTHPRENATAEAHVTGSETNP
jgi:hypothetical protein